MLVLNDVTPAHSIGAATAESRPSGTATIASVLIVTYSAYPPSRLMPVVTIKPGQVRRLAQRRYAPLMSSLSQTI